MYARHWGIMIFKEGFKARLTVSGGHSTGGKKLGAFVFSSSLYVVPVISGQHAVNIPNRF